jgi:uncharacterized protein YjbI with pentapeptide repeats
MRIWPDMPMTAMPRGFCFTKGKRYAVIMAKTEYALEPGVVGPGPEALEDAVTILLDADDPAGEPDAALVKASEQAPTKPNADVLFYGTAYAPGRIPTAGVRTRLAVSRPDGTPLIDKEIDVLGDRIWMSDGTRSDTVAFESMPMTWDRAFGGPGDRWNPAGRGRRSDELPNLERPDEHVTERDSKLKGTCYAPISPLWKPRCDKLGSYGPGYMEKHWPWLPGDFDWSHFNAAPEDQQVDGFLRGDEIIELRHLHAEHEEFRTSLPGERCRAFVVVRGRDGSEEFREVEMFMDTLTIMPDEGKVAVVWRGQTEARSMKLLEFEQLMLVREKLDEPDKGLPHFRERLQRCNDKPHEVFLAGDTATEINEGLAAAEEAKAEVEVKRAEAEEMAAKARADAQAEIEKHREQGLYIPDPEPDPMPPSRYDSINSAVRAIDEGIAAFQQLGEAEYSDRIAELRAKKDELDGHRKVLRAEYPRPTREELERAAANGTPMHYRDLTHLDLANAQLGSLDLTGSLLDHTDLSGADLSGAVFRDCMLSSTRLNGANLRGSDLRGATTVEADFTGADLSDAILDKVPLVGSKLNGCILAGASVAEGLLLELDLSDVDLSGCRGERALFFGSDLSRARFDRAELVNCVLMNATLEDASFFLADLRKAALCGVKAARASFVASDLHRAGLNLKADFTEADFRLANAGAATFQGSTLDDAWLGGAELTRSVFAEASLRGTELVCVNAPQTDFTDAVMEDTDLTHSNLFQCYFDRAEITRVHFEGASLFQSGFCETVFDTVYFADTNLKRTMLEKPNETTSDPGGDE